VGYIVIDLTMIARNEEDTIARALLCATDLCKRLIVVDTGSEDRTVDIANECGAEVLLFPWNDDFSEARNYALKQSDSKWTLTLDADEILSVDSAAFAREIENLPEEVSVVMIPVRYRGHPMTFDSARMIRIGRGNWKGACHEYLSAEKGSAYHLTSGEIIHDKPVGKENGTERNIRILLKSYKKDPYDSRTLFYLGREYRDKCEWREAIKYYLEYLPISTYPAERHRAFLDLADCYGNIGEYRFATHYLVSLLEINPRVREIYQKLAWLAYLKEDWDFSYLWAKTALDLPLNHDKILFEVDDLFPSYDYLSISCWNLEKYSEGEGYARKALAANPGDVRLQKNLEYYENIRRS
jgi:glycosyltransferase involved in cell wall biosynthesis